MKKMLLLNDRSSNLWINFAGLSRSGRNIHLSSSLMIFYAWGIGGRKPWTKSTLFALVLRRWNGCISIESFFHVCLIRVKYHIMDQLTVHVLPWPARVHRPPGCSGSWHFAAPRHHVVAVIEPIETGFPFPWRIASLSTDCKDEAISFVVAFNDGTHSFRVSVLWRFVFHILFVESTRWSDERGRKKNETTTAGCWLAWATQCFSRISILSFDPKSLPSLHKQINKVSQNMAPSKKCQGKKMLTLWINSRGKPRKLLVVIVVLIRPNNFRFVSLFQYHSRK